jgi:hypothetical protein
MGASADLFSIKPAPLRTDRAALRARRPLENICRHQAFPMSSKKRRPRYVLIALRGRIDAVFSENVGDRAAPDLMSQIRHSSSDPCVPPRSILKRHAQNEIDDRLHDERPTGGLDDGCSSIYMRPFLGTIARGTRCDQGMKSSFKTLRPRVCAFLARRRRSVSVKRMRRPPRRSFGTRSLPGDTQSRQTDGGWPTRRISRAATEEAETVVSLQRSIPADQPSCGIEQPACAFSNRVVRIFGHYGLRHAAASRSLRLRGKQS